MTFPPPGFVASTVVRCQVLERRIGVYAAVLQETENYVAIDTAGKK